MRAAAVTLSAFAGLHGNVHAFSKPWTMTWVMFWGEFLCLLYFLVSTGLRRSSRTPPTQSVALLSATDAVAEEFPPLTWRSSFVCFLPAMCDVMGTTLYVCAWHT